MGGRLDRGEGSTFLVRSGLVVMVVTSWCARVAVMVRLMVCRARSSSRMPRNDALHLDMHPRSLTLPNNQHILDRSIRSCHSGCRRFVQNRLQDPPTGINEPVAYLVH